LVAECFIIMPITTPEELIPKFHGDVAHFEHVLDHLFRPAVEAAGFEPLTPIARGADLIHAEIVRRLESSDLVLCDISCLNPNVFFELGIRTAVDRPVALVRDNFTTHIPFDTSIINFHTYDSSLAPWSLEMEVAKLSSHLKASNDGSHGRNPLWRYFGLTTRGAFRPEESPVEAKLDLILHQIADLVERARLNPPHSSDPIADQQFHTPPEVSEALAREILRKRPLGELNNIATQMGLQGRVWLRKSEVIDAILAKAQGIDYNPPKPPTRDDMD
jgi:hypothetical protein